MKSHRKALVSGARDTIPLIIGAAPFGLIYGALAVTSGLSPMAASGMSLMVFAGSAQFIAAGMVGEGVPALVIILTTFIVNLRHGLYGASLAPYLGHLPSRWLIPMAFGLTDETYAVAIREFQKEHDPADRPYYYLGSMVLMYLNWQAWTLIGIFAGQNIAGIGEWGLDFAFVATFIGIVIPLIGTMPMLASALVAGITAVLANDLPYKLGILLAAFAGIAVGMLLESQQKRTESAREAGHE